MSTPWKKFILRSVIMILAYALLGPVWFHRSVDDNGRVSAYKRLGVFKWMELKRYYFLQQPEVKKGDTIVRKRGVAATVASYLVLFGVTVYLESKWKARPIGPANVGERTGVLTTIIGEQRMNAMKETASKIVFAMSCFLVVVTFLASCLWVSAIWEQNGFVGAWLIVIIGPGILVTSLVCVVIPSSKFYAKGHNPRDLLSLRMAQGVIVVVLCEIATLFFFRLEMT